MRIIEVVRRKVLILLRFGFLKILLNKMRAIFVIIYIDTYIVPTSEKELICVQVPS